MPWNSQGGGGGPWGNGGGNRGPWGGGGGGPGNQPPDLEELLRKGQERFKQAMPGGLGSGGKLIGLGIAALVILALGSSMVYKVNPDEQGVVLRFGEWVRTEEPGLRFKLPAPIETVLTPGVTRVNRVELGYRTLGEGRGPTSAARDVTEESLMLTGDENIVDLDFSVFWRIKDAGQFLFQIRNPEETVRVAAESAMREVVGQTPINRALGAGKQEIEQKAQETLQRLLDDYKSGIQITQVQLLRVDPPSPVVDAFNDVQRARADLERLRNEAEAYRNDIIPRARGDAERIVQEAEAYKEQVVNLAEGEAQRFTSVLQAYRQAPDVISRRMYLETMENVLRGSNKVIIDPSAQGQQGVLPYLPLPELKGRAVTQPSSNQAGGQ